MVGKILKLMCFDVSGVVADIVFVTFFCRRILVLNVTLLSDFIDFNHCDMIIGANLTLIPCALRTVTGRTQQPTRNWEQLTGNWE
jgi:hypothetical protein